MNARRGRAWHASTGLAAIAVAVAAGVAAAQTVAATPHHVAGGAAVGRPQTIAQAPTPQAMVIDVLATHPHDRTAYTQGLVWDNGTIWESTGLYGESTLRRVALNTGAVLQKRDIPGNHFAEGLALVGDKLIQLTWRTGKAFVWDKSTFEPVGEFDYTGEGWGLCNNGTDLVMSDGSDTLFIRDAKTFALKDQVSVRLAGQPVDALNELECVGNSVYANVWSRTFILKIDLATGDVTQRIDGAPLDAAIRAAYGFGDPYDCLNGIAYMPETDRFLITGKHWPELYEARFRAEGEATNTPPTPTVTPTATVASTATPRAALFLPWAHRNRR